MVPDLTLIHCHEDPELFREAVNFTAAVSGFPARLIEKDYFCTVLLRYLTEVRDEIVFKGGTCLAKVHAGFYRLSEDLDFEIPTPVDAPRAVRSRRAAASNAAIKNLGQLLPGLRVIVPPRGANDSSQYLAIIGYTSLLVAREETIKIEVGLREPLLKPANRAEARTLILDPITGAPLVPPFPLRCLSLEEAMAEKLRAALSRREAAIRDFYDVDYAVRRLGLRAQDPELTGLVRKKLGVPGNDPVDVSAARLAVLRRQIDAQLKPVLRDRDLAEFDLERAFAAVAELAARVK